ncbi:MAG: CHAT domain-containing protein [Cytophagaceae bacterium]
MKLHLSLILFLISPLMFANTHADKKKVAIAYEKYLYGYYDECKIITSGISKSAAFSKDPHTAGDAFFLRAASYFRHAEIDAYNKIVKEWIGLMTQSGSDTVKFLSSVKLAQLLLEVGDVKRADSVISKFDIRLEKHYQDDADYLKAKLYQMKGEITLSDNLLSQLISTKRNYFYNNAKKETLLTGINDNNRVYADIFCLKIKSFILRGEPDSALINIVFYSDWLRKNFAEKYYLREMDILSGDIAILKNNSREAYSFYTKSYENPNFTDVEYKKLSLMMRNILLADRLGYSDESGRLMRRLQMNASISSGKKEPFEFVYEQTLAMLTLEKSNVSKVESRLKHFSAHYNKLPVWGALRIEFSSIESSIWFYKPKFNILNALDSVADLYSVSLAPGHEYSGRIMLDKINYEINYGQGLKNVSEDLNAFNENFIKKGYGGEFLLRYYNLSGSYHLLLDDVKKAALFAEKAYTYSKRIYSPASGKKFYYQALYTERLYESGDYAAFNKEYTQLKSSFNNVEWSSLEEKLHTYLVMSEIYKLLGENDENKAAFMKFIDKMQESGRENFYERAKTEQHIGYLNYTSGNIYKADKYLKKAFETNKYLLQENSVGLIENYLLIADLELSKGNISEAGKSLEKASEIISEAYGTGNMIYVEYLENQAEYALTIGDLKKADEYIQLAQKFITGKFSANDIRNVPFLVARAEIIASNDKDKKELKKIQGLYSDALKILKASIGTENGRYMEVLKEYAEYQIRIQKYPSADSMLNVVEAYWKNRLGNDNHKVLEVYTLRANIAYESGDMAKSRSLYQNVKDIAGSVYGKNSSYYTSAVAGQAKVAYMLKKPDEALNLMEEILPQYMKFVSSNFSAMSFREKSKYWNNIREEFEFYEFLVLTNKDLRDKNAAKAYEYVIATKGILLSNNIKIKQNILASKDSVLINTYNEWIDLKEYYTSASSLSKSELEAQGIDLKAIEASIEKKEKYLSHKSDLFKAEDKIANARFKDIHGILSENEYAVEIVRFRGFNKHFNDSIYYAAFVISKGKSEPQVVMFGNGNQMETKYFKYARNCAKFNVRDDKSFDIFWAPVQQLIPDNAIVYLSAEGVYNQFNLEMIPDNAGKYLLERIELVQVTNTRELLRSGAEKNRKSEGEVVLCGSPAFYLGDKKKYTYTVGELPGTEKEVGDIAELLSKNNVKTTKVMGKALTEQWVKDLENPRIFHIATHGYYSEKKAHEDENSAMLNSGLLLTGSGDILGTESHVNSKDGILTAYEAMNLRFDNTDLVVLSACETGLGEIQAGEGVYGLQRSFLIAGSKAIILSLYKVNDEVTQKLMQEFYSNYVKGTPIRKSFIQAKEKIKQEYPDAPIYWGAFVLIEGQPRMRRVN